MGHLIFGAAAACGDGVALSVYSRFLNPEGEGIPDTTGAGRIVLYSRSSASSSGGRRIVGLGHIYERVQFLYLRCVQFLRALHLLHQRGGDICGGGTRGSFWEVVEC